MTTPVYASVVGIAPNATVVSPIGSGRFWHEEAELTDEKSERAPLQSFCKKVATLTADGPVRATCTLPLTPFWDARNAKLIQAGIRVDC